MKLFDTPLWFPEFEGPAPTLYQPQLLLPDLFAFDEDSPTADPTTLYQHSAPEAEVIYCGENSYDDPWMHPSYKAYISGSESASQSSSEGGPEGMGGFDVAVIGTDIVAGPQRYSTGQMPVQASQYPIEVASGASSSNWHLPASGMQSELREQTASFVPYLPDLVASESSSLPPCTFDGIDPKTEPQEAPVATPSAQQGSNNALNVVYLASCSSAPPIAIRKLIFSKLFQDLEDNASLRGTPMFVVVASVGSSAKHDHNVWKFFYTLQYSNGARGPRQAAFVCNNPLSPTCENVSKESGSARNHQTTNGHGAANLVCERCNTVFNTGRRSALARHKATSCLTIQKRRAKAAAERSKKTRKNRQKPA